MRFTRCDYGNYNLRCLKLTSSDIAVHEILGEVDIESVCTGIQMHMKMHM